MAVFSYPHLQLVNRMPIFFERMNQALLGPTDMYPRIAAVVFLLFPCLLSGQDLELSPRPLKLCTPGVYGMAPGKGLELYHEWSPDYDLVSPGLVQHPNFLSQSAATHVYSEIRYRRRMGVKLAAPILLKPGLKLILRGKYQRESFQFAAIPAVENTLHQPLAQHASQILRLELIGVKPLDERHYIALRSSAAVGSNSLGSASYTPGQSTYTLTALWGKKTDAYTEWGVGLAQSLRFGEYMAYPVFLYNKTFSPKWGLEMLLPARVALRHNLHTNTILSLESAVGGGAFQIFASDVHPLGQQFQFRESALRLSLMAEQQLLPMVWMEAAIGYNQPIGYKYVSSRVSDPVVSQLESSWFTRLSFSVRAPR